MTDEKNSDERRQSPRVEFKTEIVLNTPSQSYRLEGSSGDISRKGIYIYTKEDIPVETVCEVKVVLSGAQPPVVIDVKGRVARKTDDGIGVEFREMDLDSFSHLKKIIEYNSTETS